MSFALGEEDDRSRSHWYNAPLKGPDGQPPASESQRCCREAASAAPEEDEDACRSPSSSDVLSPAAGFAASRLMRHAPTRAPSTNVDAATPASWPAE